METVAPDDRDLGRLRGIYRQRWAAGRQHVAAAERAIGVLDARGIPVVGPADQHVARIAVEPLVVPLVTPRLTVPERSVASAVDALLDAGWRLRPHEDRGSVRRRVLQREWHLQLETQPGLQVVVGVDPSPDVRDDRYAREVWTRATATDGSRHDPGATDLLLAVLSETPHDQHAMRWAIGSAALARATEAFDDATSVFSAPAVAYLLPCLVSRLEFLLSVDQGSGSLGAALAAARAARRNAERRAAPPARVVARQLAHRSRQLRVLAASIRRHGGLGETIMHVFRGRR